MEHGLLESKYLERFKKWENYPHVEMTGDGLIVEKIETEVKTASGLFLTTDGNQVQKSMAVMKPVWVRVLYTGKGFVSIDEAGNEVTEPLPVSAGDIVVVGDASVRWVSTFGLMLNLQPETLGFTRIDQVQLHFKGSEALLEAFKILNG